MQTPTAQRHKTLHSKSQRKKPRVQAPMAASPQVENSVHLNFEPQIFFYQNNFNMTTASCFNIFLLATFFLFYNSILAAPTQAEITGPTVKGLELATMSPYFTQLMKVIPLIPPPENATALAAFRKGLEDAINTFNLNYAHLEGEEATSASHPICETSGASPK
ncbi:hypothetical protein HOY80DRAFT_1091949 [Tuber brumale]|nr:hypothetical protein HOY80DRAFT_1091949 [Tuber brumale]